MNCPKCKSENLEQLPRDYVIPGSEHGSMARASNPNGLPIFKLIGIGTAVAKMTVYRAYKCKSCLTQFRHF